MQSRSPGWRQPALAALTMLFLLPALAGDDPTAGPVVLFPGPLAPYDNSGAAASQTLGWNIPGHNFKGGDGWWALACEKACTLTPVSLKVSAATHAQYDGDPLPSQFLRWSPLPYGLGVSPDLNANSAATPDATLLAIFKPLRALAAAFKPSPGPVKTWLHIGMGDTYPVPPGRNAMGTLIVTDNGAQAMLIPRQISPADAAKMRAAGETPSDAPVFELRAEGKRQSLGQYEWDIDGPGPLTGPEYLRWAGDLDGDGKLDLLISHAARRWHMALYLSSLAKPGELVGEAGRFQFWPPDDPGC